MIILTMMFDHFFPYHDVGCIGNPFQALTPELQAEACVMPEPVRTAWSGGGCMQILGESGRGKTTVLLALYAEARHGGKQAVYEMLLEGKNRFRTSLNSVELFFLDEAQRLTVRERRRLLHWADVKRRRIILSSHEDLAADFLAAGVAMETVYLNTASEKTLSQILDRRLVFFANGRPQAKLDRDAVAFLLERYGGKLRAMERMLFEYWYAEKPAENITRAMLESFRAI